MSLWQKLHPGRTKLNDFADWTFPTPELCDSDCGLYGWYVKLVFWKWLVTSLKQKKKKRQKLCARSKIAQPLLWFLIFLNALDTKEWFFKHASCLFNVSLPPARKSRQFSNNLWMMIYKQSKKECIHTDVGRKGRRKNIIQFWRFEHLRTKCIHSLLNEVVSLLSAYLYWNNVQHAQSLFGRTHCKLALSPFSLVKDGPFSSCP